MATLGGQDDHKLIEVSDVPDELFDLGKDPLESTNLIEERPETATELISELDRLQMLVKMQSEMLEAGAPLDLEEDEQLVQRLRGLGYIE